MSYFDIEHPSCLIIEAKNVSLLLKIELLLRFVSNG